MEFPIVDLSVSNRALTPEIVESYFRKGELFNERGKWKYTVWLDYRDLDWNTWDLWSNTQTALVNATKLNLSGVTFQSVPNGWVLVVLEPWGQGSHPIMVDSTDTRQEKCTPKQDGGKR